MRILAKEFRYIWFGICFLFLWSCNNSISRFSEQAYQQDVTLKVESLAIISKANEPYKKHEKEISKLKEKLDIAYEYAKGRPKNEITTRQWKIMINPDRHLLGGFLKRWKEQTSLSPYFIKQASGQISSAFDTIIDLESGKIKPTEAK